jgi:hypothetical protein
MGRPLKIIKVQSAASPDGEVDNGYPNDGTTDNGFSRSYPGILGGRIPNFNASDMIECSVAIEKKQYGVVNSTSGIAVIWGYGITDYANTVSIGDSIYVGDALTDPTVAALGTVNTINTPVPTITIDAATAGATDSFTTKGAVTTAALVGNGPIVLSTDYAGLTGGTVYYVKTIVDGTHFTVSATPGGAKLDLSAETADITAQQYPSITLDAGATVTVSNSAFTNSTPAANDGYVVRQKGKRKFLVVEKNIVNDEFICAGGSYMIISVSNTNWEALGAGPDAAAGKVFTATINGVGLTTNGTVYPIGICTLVNTADASLTRNQMNLNLNFASDPDAFAASVTNHFAVDFTDNGVDENPGTKYIATLGGASDTPDPATGLIYVEVDNYC